MRAGQPHERRLRLLISPLLLVPVMLLVATSAAVAADQDGDGLRDGFETRWGITDPELRDSDGDGVIDAAEDEDGDRLSNLGEQRFGTNPGEADSDGDGTADGKEDKDRDGVSNAREQDRRPIPSGLRPSLKKANDDVPAAHKECFSRLGFEKPLRCTYGDPESEWTIALFGDSHALHWVPGLRRAVEQEGWRLVTLLKGGCPSVDVQNIGQYRVDGNRSCDQWRRNALAWLRQHPPDLVILANSDGYNIVKSDGSIVTKLPARLKRWHEGLTRTIDRLPGRSAVMILGEVPANDGDPIPCLRSNQRDMSACQTRRQAPAKRRFELVERKVADDTRADFRTLFGKICSYDPCPLVQGDILIWRDHAHMTATFSRLLAPSLVETIRPLLEGEAALDEVGSGDPEGVASPAPSPSPSPAEMADQDQASSSSPDTTSSPEMTTAAEPQATAAAEA